MGRNPNHIGEHPNIGGSFDEFLKGEGILDEIENKVFGKDEEEFDRCVGVKDDGSECNAETPYRKTDHIDTRGCYVEGAGQLCLDCWKRTYGSL